MRYDMWDIPIIIGQQRYGVFQPLQKVACASFWVKPYPPQVTNALSIIIQIKFVCSRTSISRLILSILL